MTKLFGKVLQNYSYFALFKWNPNLLGIFLKNPPDDAGHSQICFNIKKLFVSEKTQKSELCNFSLESHLVDFWEKFPTDLDFIWIEQTSYNSGVLLQIVWSCISERGAWVTNFDKSRFAKLLTLHPHSWCMKTENQNILKISLHVNFFSTLSLPKMYQRFSI